MFSCATTEQDVLYLMHFLYSRRKCIYEPYIVMWCQHSFMKCIVPIPQKYPMHCSCNIMNYASWPISLISYFSYTTLYVISISNIYLQIINKCMKLLLLVEKNWHDPHWSYIYLLYFMAILNSNSINRWALCYNVMCNLI